MLTTFQWICLFSILAVTLAGGYYPLFHQEKVRQVEGIPMAEAFTTGVFLALASMMMLPSSVHLIGVSFQNLDFPLGVLIAIMAFLLLLAIEHHTHNLRTSLSLSESSLTPPVIPIIMTVMIAIPSFFLGTALGISDSGTAILIFVAIMMHKSSAAFALSLKMVRSTMSRSQIWLVFGLFAAATPLGIIAGQEIHNLLGASTLVLVKGIVLGLAAGTFLFMSTLHELKHTPLITMCNSRRGYALMLAGFLITALVRLIMGEAHKLAG